MKIPDLLPGAEPFFFRGGATGCLVLHGYTASPQEMRGLGEHLAAQGHTVYGPRLAHHGTQPADMNRARWRDWYFSALDGYHVLRTQCEQVVVIGLSMGAAIALMLASQQPVAAVVAMGTSIYMDFGWQVRFARLVSYVYPYITKPPLSGDPPWDVRVDYRVRPLRSLAEFADYMPAVDAILPQVGVPVLLMHAKNDELVPPENMGLIYDRLGSADKKKVWIEDSDHVITEDREKERVWAIVAEFVQAQV